jgi:hypothetical protein
MIRLILVVLGILFLAFVFLTNNYSTDTFLTMQECLEYVEGKSGASIDTLEGDYLNKSYGALDNGQAYQCQKDGMRFVASIGSDGS